MNTQNIFDNTLESARELFMTIKAGTDCLPDEMILSYVYNELSGEEYHEVSEHIRTCERCHMEVLKMEADRTEWELTVSEYLRPSFVSQIREEMIRWLSPIWEPLWTGEMISAADMTPQKKAFEMEYGEYINITCYWQGRDSSSSPFIHLKWNANILSPSNLWARFADPDTHEILFEDCLGPDLEGEKDFHEQDIGFDPSNRKWAISVVVEEM